MFEFLKRNKDDYIRLARIALGTSNKLSESEVINLLKKRHIKYFKKAYEFILYPELGDFTSIYEWNRYIIRLFDKWHNIFRARYNLKYPIKVNMYGGLSIFLTSLCNDGSFLSRYSSEGKRTQFYEIEVNEKAPNMYYKDIIHNVILHELTHIVCEELNRDTEFDILLSDHISEFKDKGYVIKDIKYSRDHNFSNCYARLKSVFVNFSLESNLVTDSDALDRIKKFRMLDYDVESNYNPDNYIKL